MTIVSFMLMIACAAGGGSSLSGQVFDNAGEPLARARVFVEQGLAGSIRESRTDNEGRYRFDNVASGTIGVFAIADGHGFGGLSITVPSDEDVRELTIRLRPPVTLSGRIVNEAGEPVSGARVMRIGLMNEPQSNNPHATTKLGIPYAKLEPMGFPPITTDDRGRFTVSALPRDGSIALKAACHGYAQQGVADLRAGDSNVEIVLTRGVLVRGRVVTRATRVPLSGAVVVLRNAQPPHDTALTRTDGSGDFAIRLQPGVYLYRASGGGFQGVGWEELLVTGQQSAQSVTIYAAASCDIRGKVANAMTGEPVGGARVVLRTFGNPDSSARTNTRGEYALRGVEGENTVILESAPGFILPERNARPVHAAENERVELPTFWVLPMPEVHLTVVDEELEPAPRCVTSLVQPPQFGWQAADDSGRVPLRIGQLASEGVVLGRVEHLDHPLGALFAFTARDNSEPVVQLLPHATITGRVASESGSPVPGVAVSVFLVDDQMESPLWRTVSGPDGRFEIPGAVPHATLVCVAASSVHTAASAPFVLEPLQTKDVGALTMPRSAAGTSLLGQRLDWQAFSRLAGPDAREAGQQPAVLAFCPQEQAMMTIEAWQRLSTILSTSGLTFAVVVDAPVTGIPEPSVVVLEGKRPATASTYLVSAEGRVVSETFGLPSVTAIQQLQQGAR